MNTRFTQFLFLIFILISFPVFSQNLNINDNHDWDDWDDWDDHIFDWMDESRPMVELNYSIGSLNHNDLQGEFNDVGSVDFKLGYSTIDGFMEDYILEHSEKFVFGSMIGSSIHYDYKNMTQDKYNSDLSRFGGGRTSGYGYLTGAVSILPYTQSGLVWTKLTEVDSADYDIDQAVFDSYYDTFRFGETGAAGLKIQFGSMVALNSAYEFSVVYSRHLFWYWLGSFAIEKGGMALLDKFVDEIFDGTPAAGPVLNWLLKNAYSYGFFLLRKENMNWPFDTAPPMTYETFKLGLSFTF
jgi:opacity protein-like surface antigen